MSGCHREPTTSRTLSPTQLNISQSCCSDSQINLLQFCEVVTLLNDKIAFQTLLHGINSRDKADNNKEMMRN